MSPAQLLRGQVVTLGRALNQAGASLEIKTGDLSSELLKLVSGRFRNDLKALSDRCQSLVSKIEDGASTETGWAQLRTLQQDAEAVMRECLAFMEGARIRQDGLDGGICALADSMLYDLSRRTDLRWQRFSLIAPGEFYSTLSGIVRLRFTDIDIWNLPVAAHEFGHFAGGAPIFEEFRQLASSEKSNDPRYESHLRELFSDLFATYAMGPSFLLNCVLLRFSPAGANQPSTTHPSDSERVWWMLEALKMMNLEDYGPLAAKVTERWTAALQAAGSAAIPGDVTARLRPWLADLFDLMNTHIPAVRYENFLRAKQLSRGFEKHGNPKPNADDAIADILNAAWLYRLDAAGEDVYGFDEVGRKAREICSQIANR